MIPISIDPHALELHINKLVLLGAEPSVVQRLALVRDGHFAPGFVKPPRLSLLHQSADRLRH
jgi:hypothetical protein